MPERPSIEFTGRNSALVRAWVNADPGCDDTRETWFIAKGSTAFTGGQTWRYIRGDQEWPEDIRAAFYDPRTGTWTGVRAGDVIERQGSGYGLRA